MSRWVQSFFNVMFHAQRGNKSETFCIFMSTLLLKINLCFLDLEPLLFYSSSSLYPQKLALTSPTGGGRSVGIVRSRTKATEFCLLLKIASVLHIRYVFRLDRSFVRCVDRIVISTSWCACSFNTDTQPCCIHRLTKWSAVFVRPGVHKFWASFGPSE